MADRKGTKAPDFELPDLEGVRHRLADFEGRWLLLVFHRHLGWLPCREHLSQLRQREEEIAALGLQVVVVTFQGLVLARAYAKETKLPWPILVDESLALYTEYGMGRGRVRDVLGPASWIAYGKLMLRGRRPRAAAGDPYQLGGDVLIDPGGIVRLHHVGSGPADRPEVEGMLEIVRGV